jgi:P27 family predicted phage terminase small subunit
MEHMGKRGPKPKPVELKRLEGNPGARPLNDDAPQPSGRPVRPDYLPDYACEVWDRLVGAMPTAIYTAADQDLLAAYCMAAHLHREAARQAEDEGMVLDGKERKYVNPCLRVLSDSAQKMAVIGSRLGLDPAARATLRVPKDEKPKSKFEGLVAFPGGQSGS